MNKQSQTIKTDNDKSLREQVAAAVGKDIPVVVESKQQQEVNIPQSLYRVEWLLNSAPLEDERIAAFAKLDVSKYYILIPTIGSKSKLLSAHEQLSMAKWLVELLKNWRIKGRIVELEDSKNEESSNGK